MVHPINPSHEAYSMRKLLLLAFVATLAACGVPDDKAISELTDDERAELCTGETSDEKTCNEGEATEYTVEASDEDDCAEGLKAIENGTVGDWRACKAAGDGVDVCDADALTELADDENCKALAGE
jgi:hypothetical protein